MSGDLNRPTILCSDRSFLIYEAQRRGLCNWGIVPEVFITMTSQWAWWRLRSPASRLFTQPFIQTQIKENIKAPRHWPLCGEFTGGRWIPRTNGQLRGKCFHLMTSSCLPSGYGIALPQPTPFKDHWDNMWVYNMICFALCYVLAIWTAVVHKIYMYVQSIVASVAVCQSATARLPQYQSNNPDRYGQIDIA